MTDQSPEAHKWLNENVYVNISDMLGDLERLNLEAGTLYEQPWYEDLFMQVRPVEDEDEDEDEDVVQVIEPYEFWFVSNYFARLLEEQGEAVTDYWYTRVWGRSTTGQSIILDHAFQEAWKKHKS